MPRPLLVHVYCKSTDMAFKFFSKSSSSLPSAKDTGIGEARPMRLCHGYYQRNSHSSRAQCQQIVRKLSENTLRLAQNTGPRPGVMLQSTVTLPLLRSSSQIFKQGLGESMVWLFKKREAKESQGDSLWESLHR